MQLSYFRQATHQLFTLALVGMFAVMPLMAQQPPAVDLEALRKAAQNPIADLISVPIQENWNFNIPPYNRTQNVLNIQPVVPVGLGQKWNLIVRWISPVVFQPEVSTTELGFYGLGDMNPSFFISPKKSKVTWGLGPTFVLPTAMNTEELGEGKWSMGPTAVVMVQPGKWTIGVLINNVWSVAGHQDRQDVNQMLVQYFVNYNLKHGYYLTTAPINTFDWKAPEGSKSVIPLGGGFGRIMKFGPQHVNVYVQGYGNADHPPGTSSWTLRMEVAFLYPKG
jgi:hypothetical protein